MFAPEASGAIINKFSQPIPLYHHKSKFHTSPSLFQRILFQINTIFFLCSRPCRFLISTFNDAIIVKYWVIITIIF